MQGHGAANVVPVIAANRVGKERVTPTKDNNNQFSELLFYGSSFITDETGELLEDAGRRCSSIPLTWTLPKGYASAGDCSGTGARRCTGRL